MAINAIVGIGGTGAKVVEAVLHSCSAGLGPDRLHIGFVDQDRSNGNVSRALEALTTIDEARSHWRTSGGPHFVADGDLLRTDVVPIEEGLWVPHGSHNTSLSEILGDLGPDRRLFDLLFEGGVAEQEMMLDEGYRGRAHIGSAAITCAVQRSEHPFWRSLFDLIRQAEGGETVRLLLAGSVFGGTGAAGFPTIARLIRDFLRNENIGVNFSLGGILMLPYFRFDPPEDDSANVARAEDLLPQTRGALRYYASLLERSAREKSPIFDELMMVGWDTPFNLGYHRHGTGDQRNPSLVPELIGAMGACRFFNADHKPQFDRVLVSAREREDAITWADVPSPDRDPDFHYKKFGKQLRFAAAWKHWAPVLAKEGPAWRPSYRRHSWYKRFGLSQIDYDAAPPTDAIRSLSRYIDDLIEWSAAMQVYAVQSGLRFELWDLQTLLAGAADYANPQHPLTLRVALDEAAFGEASRTVIHSRMASHSLTDAAWMLNYVNTASGSAGSSGLGGIVGALHSASEPAEPRGMRSAANAGL